MRPQVSRFSPEYSYRQAAGTRAFAQFPLLSSTRFAAACKKRGVSLGMGTTLLESLEEFDRSGALRPVLFQLSPTRGPSLVEVADKALFPEESGFIDWSGVAARTEPRDEDDEQRPRPFYSWWQLLYAWDVIDLGVVRVSVEALAEREGFAPRGAAAKLVDMQREIRGSLDECWRGAILLLTRLQNRFGPRVKGRIGHASSTTVFDPTQGAMVDPWIQERASFDAAVVLRELRLTTEHVKDLHFQLAMRAGFEDPLEHWHPLSRMAPFSERQKLKGAALRAQDSYDAADMLRWSTTSSPRRSSLMPTSL